MSIILVQEELRSQEKQALYQEFPGYSLAESKSSDELGVAPGFWSKIEIIYGSRLSTDELYQAHQLRWIHAPSPILDNLCLDEIKANGNILLTSTEGQHNQQIGEFAMGSLLGIAKHLFKWGRGEAEQKDLAAGMWSLKNRIFLQVGLGRSGTEITRLARGMSLRVWGLDERCTFHPHCHKTYSPKDLHSLLPVADVVCIAAPRGRTQRPWFSSAALSLIRDGAIFILIGSEDTVDAEGLYHLAETGRLRGMALDVSPESPIANIKNIKKLENVIVTPGVATLPETETRLAFRTFHYNLRQFTHGNFWEMRNLVDEATRDDAEHASL